MPPDRKKNEVVANRQTFIGGSDARINDESALRLWPEERGEVKPEGLSGNLVVQLGVNRLWYEAIAGGLSLGSYIVIVCYATAVIFLGWYPWNFLLLGLLFLIRNKPLRERAFVWRSSRGPDAYRPG